MPFVPVAFDLPPDVVELRVGDADADGRDELVLAASATTVSSTSTAGKTYLFLSSDL